MTTSRASSAEDDLDARVGANLAALRQRIEASGRDPGGVRVVAVTKGFSSRHVDAARHAGLSDVGENYAQELTVKRAAVTSPLTWHFIGPIQRNKVAGLCREADVLSGVSRMSELTAIATQPRRPRLRVQVDYTNDASRHGVAPSDAGALVLSARELGLRIEGLMTVAPTDRRAAEMAFGELRELADALDLPERSMGMSDDLEIALRHGTTELRVGSALFGPRPKAR